MSNTQKIGYVRVSSVDQNTDRQLDGLTLDKIFTDKASGKSTDRPALTECLKYIRTGDTLVVHSMDRLARNLDDLRSIVKTLTDQNIKVEFVKESLVFTGEDSPMSTLLLSVIGAFAEFKRSLIKERQKEGIAIAKKAGKYKGRKPAFTAEQIEEIKKQIEAGVPKAKIARDYGVTRQTLYGYFSTKSQE
jgi:DNA invertase Pin-like site-specific DNA recombinase